ncbi:MAG TPA: glyoxylate/hydroxypyruvate reductase A [Alphaproteobacteria bacterium]|nr:glyoxylate/hydroxypyruvate reductase A [Alphaproteobacteria bacterium]
MALLFKSDADRADWWKQEIGTHMPGLDVRIWPETGDVGDIEYAVVWKIKPGVLATFPNLRFIFSLGAGVDHLFSDPTLPKNVPICRVVDRFLTQRMTEHVVLHALRYHRRQPEIEAQQREQRWDELYTPTAQERAIGVMGMGELGADAAVKLSLLGFKVAGWSRTAKHIDGIESFHGPSGLGPFLARTEILVCLLPLTPETEGILNARLFAGLPKGAAIINVARGRHLVEEDLLAALASGQISYAALDVFREEPLPAAHLFWRHPHVSVSPHNASITDPRSVSALLVDNIRRAQANAPLLNVVDPNVGY